LRYAVLIALVGLLGFFLFLSYGKLRPYLQSARQIIDAIKQLQQSLAGGRNAPSTRSEKLVQCARCGTWVPVGRALSARNDFFCSEECRREGVIRGALKGH
jgi:hypothetical protein